MISDMQGSVRQVMSSGGSPLEKYDYDANGNIIIDRDSNGNALSGRPSRVGYAGMWYEPQTEVTVNGTTQSGLSYDVTRYVDPNTGRFTSQDPARQGTNWYAYAGNDSATNYDPDGRFFVKGTDFGAAAGSAVGSLFGSQGLGAAIGGLVGGFFSGGKGFAADGGDA